jgi:hypothetical protein
MSLGFEHPHEPRRNCLVVLDEEHARLGHTRDGSVRSPPTSPVARFLPRVDLGEVRR